MPNFLSLPSNEQAELYRIAGQTLKQRQVILEKDVWVCWALQTLFALRQPPRMVFKGGTSLSKVFNLLDHFSEDVDVSLDYRDLGVEGNPYVMGSNDLKRFGESLKTALKRQVHEVIEPHFQQAIQQQGLEATLSVSKDGEQFEVFYPTAFRSSGYIRPRVLIEIGGRNLTEPNQLHTVAANMAAEISRLSFPVAQVNVLSPERTFWEKATLIHAEVSRPEARATERYARHWYDLDVLRQSHFGAKALANRAQFEQVVAHKKVFFRAASANYDDCLTGGLRLIPSKDLQTVLEGDFAKMIDEGMFANTPPDFRTVLEALEQMQNQINQPG